MIWIIHQTLFRQTVEIENSPNFNGIKVSRYTVVLISCVYALLVGVASPTGQTSSREVVS